MSSHNLIIYMTLLSLISFCDLVPEFVCGIILLIRMSLKRGRKQKKVFGSKDGPIRFDIGSFSQTIRETLNLFPGTGVKIVTQIGMDEAFKTHFSPALVQKINILRTYYFFRKHEKEIILVVNSKQISVSACSTVLADTLNLKSVKKSQ